MNPEDRRSSSESDEEKYDEWGQLKKNTLTEEEKDQERRRRNSSQESDVSDELEITREQWERARKIEESKPKYGDGADAVEEGLDEEVVSSEVDLDYSRIKAQTMKKEEFLMKILIYD